MSLRSSGPLLAQVRAPESIVTCICKQSGRLVHVMELWDGFLKECIFQMMESCLTFALTIEI